MFIVESYPLAVAMCVVTMLCWGSWANTQKLATQEWRFQLFYWDYAIGVFLFSIVLAFTLGSHGEFGRGFVADLLQADVKWLGSAFVGGVRGHRLCLVGLERLAKSGLEHAVE